MTVSRPAKDPVTNGNLAVLEVPAPSAVGEPLDSGLGVLRPRAERGRRGRAWLIHRLLLSADLLGVALAFCAAELILRHAGAKAELFSFPRDLLVLIVALPAYASAAYLGGLYGRDVERADHSTVDDFVGVVAAVTIATWVYSAIAWTTHIPLIPALGLIPFWAMAILLVVCGRASARAVARRNRLFIQKVVIVGAGEIGQLVARKLLQHPEYGVQVAGFVDAQPKERRDDLGDVLLLGPSDRLAEIVARYDVDRIIIAFSNDSHEDVLKLARELKASSIQIDVVPRFFDVIGPRVTVHTVEGLPLIGLPPARLSPSARLAKRGIDLLVAGLALLLTAPLFAFIAWRIRRDSPGPVLFRQTRLGLNMKEFRALKFRTMYTDTDDAAHRQYVKETMSFRAPASTNGLYKPQRGDAVTRVGRWLRRSSLDELPQLINVLKGEMSLVGPRPCLRYETEDFVSYHYERFLVPAGMTGLWQVTARARSTFGEALDMDVAYARNWSLGLDLRILCRTPIALLRQATV